MLRKVHKNDNDNDTDTPHRFLSFSLSMSHISCHTIFYAGQKAVSLASSSLVHTRPRQSPNLLPVQVKDDWNRRQSHRQERQQTRCPIDAELVIHGRAEEGEPGPEEAADERVGGDGAVGIEQVHVDDVLEALDEDDEHGTADGDGGDDLRDPARARVARPREPEEADGEDDGADDHGREAALGDGEAGGARVLPGEDRDGVGDDCGEADDDADEERDEG